MVTVTKPTSSNTIQPTNYGMSQEFRDKQSMNKKIGIGIGIFVLIGLIMIARKYPKATFITIGVLLVYVYFFVGFWNPSRYEQWKNRQSPKTAHLTAL
mgnify:FL=1